METEQRKRRGPRRKPKRGTARQDAAEQRQDPATIVLTVAFGDWSLAGKAKVERIRQDLSQGLGSICGGIQSRPADDRRIAQDRLEISFDVRPRRPMTERSILGSLSRCGVQVTAVRIVGKNAPVSNETKVTASSRPLSHERPAPSSDVQSLQRENAELREQNDRLRADVVKLLAEFHRIGLELRKRADLGINVTLESNLELQSPRRAFRTPF